MYALDTPRAISPELHARLASGLNAETWAALPPAFQPEVLPLIEALLDIDGVEGFHLRELWVFGSCSRGDFNEHSDLDLLAIIDDGYTSPNPRLQAGRAVAKSDAYAPYEILVISKSDWEREKSNICTILPDINRERKKLYGR